MLWPWPISTNLFGNSAAVTPFVWARGQHLIWEKPKKFPLCPVSLVAHCFCPGWRHLPTDKRVWAGCLLPWSLLLSRFCLSLTSDSAPRAFCFSEDHLTHWIHNRVTEDMLCVWSCLYLSQYKRSHLCTQCLHPLYGALNTDSNLTWYYLNVY